MAKKFLDEQLEPLERAAYRRGLRVLDLRGMPVEPERLVIEAPASYYGTIRAGIHLAQVKDLRQSLAECRRVLRPGGRLVGAIWTRQGRDFARGLYFFARKQVRILFGSLQWRLIERKIVFRRPPDKHLEVFILEAA